MLQVRSTTSVVRPFRAGTSPATGGVHTRTRLFNRIDEALTESRLVLVGAEAGSGKTLLVSDWASRADSGTRICWRSLREAEDAIEALDALPAEVLNTLDPPGRRLRTIGVGLNDGRQQPASSVPHRWVFVLDDFPVEPADLVNTALDTLLRRTGPQVSFLVVCSGSPALDCHRLGLSGNWRPIESDDLAMQVGEIAEALSRQQVEPGASVIERVHELTAGWTWGVEQAATSLTRATSATAALRQTELAIADYLENSILNVLSRRERDLITAASVILDVTPALAAGIVGDQRRLAPSSVTAARGFIQTRGDGSFTVHPLLRRHLRRKLNEQPDGALGAARRAAQCTADHGDSTGAIGIAVEAGDWTWAAGMLIESLGVPRWLALGTEHPLDRADVVDGLGRAQPLLRAVAALGRSWPDAAESAVRELPFDQTPVTGSAAEQLSRALVQMSLARWRADAATGLTQLRRASALLPKLTVTQRTAAPELSPLLQAHLAAFELWNDAPDRARTALEHGARAFRLRPSSEIEGATQVVAADCLGRLAWLEASNGELTKALHHASEVLTARPADSNEIGVIHAQLATVWCHISRSELEQAGQRLESVTARHPAPDDDVVHPEVAAATALTVARLDAVMGQGRIIHGAVPRCLPGDVTGRLEDQLRLIRVEAELDSGQAAAALQLLAEVRRPLADAHALRARAAIQLGDLASVGASLRLRPVEPRSLVNQVSSDLIQGWMAQARGDRQQLRALVDRALRVAGREQLRAPIAWAATWLHEVVTSDPTLERLHGTFLGSVRRSLLDDPPPHRAFRLSVLTAPVPPLTERELEVLQRLGTLSTNTEIAVALYLSPNTVKTHLKSLYRKLEVTRRSDAFRRGRSLGLC